MRAKSKAKLIYIGFMVLVLGLLAISCGDEKVSTTPEANPTPIVKSISFVVHSKGTHTVDIKSPWDGARVEGTMQSNFDINFGVRDPQHMVLSAYIKVTDTNFSFVTTSQDTYQLYFDNSQQEESRRVSLSYTIYPQ
jgi:hypothetical protein